MCRNEHDANLRLSERADCRNWAPDLDDSDHPMACFIGLRNAVVILAIALAAAYLLAAL